MTNSKPRTARPILLAEISGVHGIRGEVVVRAYTAKPSDVAAYGPLQDESGRREFALTVRRVTDKGVIATVAGVADRTAAEKLKGTKLYVTRDKLPATAANEYYHADLVGLAAVAVDGTPIGTVVRVENFGAGDLLEMERPGTSATEYVAFTNANVPEVDIAGGRLVIVMPESVEGEEPGGEDGSADA